MGVTSALLGAALVSSLGLSAKNMYDQKKAQEKAEDASKKQNQLLAEKAPETATQDPLSASIKKRDKVFGIKDNILSRSKQNSGNVAAGVGTKTLLGQ